MGLPSDVYDEIIGAVNVIVHNAWMLNFNVPLSEFEGNIKDTRSLIDLAMESKARVKPKIIFISSIAIAQSGYVESKYVCERLLSMSGLNAVSIRVGQVTGGEPVGAWNVTDWVPILLRSSLSMNIILSSKGVISWVSCDAAAASTVDVVFSAQSTPGCLNLVHPKPISWNKVFGLMIDELQRMGVDTDLKFVPFSDWVTQLQKSAALSNKETLDRIPAIKLLDFFAKMAKDDENVKDDTEAGGLPRFSIEKMRSVSPTFSTMRSLGEDHVKLWIKFWKDNRVFTLGS